LSLLLSFIEAITHHHQYQREGLADENGEVYIETTPEDIEWAFKLLRDVLFRKSDELSGACREFYEWVGSPDRQFNRTGFYASEVRQERRINPRTLSRYLQELTAFGKLQITGGNKYKTGYQYSLTDQRENLQDSIDQQISKVLEQVNKAAALRNKKRKSA
jgi:DNA-binding HxlR family transcriptional regulator